MKHSSVQLHLGNNAEKKGTGLNKIQWKRRSRGGGRQGIFFAGWNKKKIKKNQNWHNPVCGSCRCPRIRMEWKQELGAGGRCSALVSIVMWIQDERWDTGRERGRFAGKPEMEQGRNIRRHQEGESCWDDVLSWEQSGFIAGVWCYRWERRT